MVELPPYVWAGLIIGMTAYLGAVSLWHELLRLWHTLPHVGHGIIHVVTLGVK